jgi:hypothetical protein
MIRVLCPNCQSKLNAKEELVGQMRNCPKCGNPVRIVAEETPPVEEAAEGPSIPIEVNNAPALLRPVVPEALVRHHRYLVCDRQRVIATWQNDGQGWLARTDKGFATASRNMEQLPNQGEFKLIELKIAHEAERLRLVGIHVYRLAERWALVKLGRGDDAILKVVMGNGSLSRDQKCAVRQHLKDHITYEFWEDAHAVREFLTNADHHSPGIDEPKPQESTQGEPPV